MVIVSPVTTIGQENQGLKTENIAKNLKPELITLYTASFFL